MCCSCHFQSNNPEAVKVHLAEHVLQQKETRRVKSNVEKYKDKMLKSKNWRNMYDNHGNPLFDSTDSETDTYEDEE